MKNILYGFLFFIISILLSGCGGGNEIIEINLKCDDNTNSGNAVVITVYQLTNADKFHFSSFEELTKNPEQTLGADLIPGSKFERTMVPGETFSFEELEIKREAAFLGIIADFHSPSADGWQQLVPLTESFDQLIISVHENTISYKIDD